MSEIHGVIVDALPTDLFFSEDETPTPAKVEAMLTAMKGAGYSVRGMAIEGELSSIAVWLAEQYVELAAQLEAQGWARVEGEE